MFSIFNKKKFIADFIPHGYVDIHSHVIPGIDDGAKTLEDSMYLLKTLNNLGAEKLYVTPHTSAHIWPNTPEIIYDGLKSLQAIIPEINTNMQLKAASEYLLDDSMLQKLDSGSVLTYKDQTILVEFSYLNVPMNYQQVFFEIQLKGYTPILAQPERYSYFNNHPEVFKELKKTGVKLQLNLLSLVGYYGPEAQKMAETLLKLNMYDFTGTDLHHKQHCKALEQPIKVKTTHNLKNIMENNTILF